MREKIEEHIRYLKNEGRGVRGITSGDSDYLFFLGLEQGQIEEIYFLESLLFDLSPGSDRTI